MMNDSQRQREQQIRLLLAVTLSMLVLTAWTYFFAPEPSKEQSQTVKEEPQQQEVSKVSKEISLTEEKDNFPNRTITIKTPLYEVKIDSKGALVTSWILIKNVHDQHEKLLFADGGNGISGKPLELIPDKALETRMLPFRLFTGNEQLDALVNERNYEISESESIIELSEGQSRQISFRLKTQSGVEVTKTFSFKADSYLTDFSVQASVNGSVLDDLKLLVGAGIGDKAIVRHNYYHIEPEAVALIGETVERYGGYYFTYNGAEAKRVFTGNVNWAAVGDTYFVTSAIPLQPVSQVEFRSLRYEVPVEPFYDGIFAWITRHQTTKLTKHMVSAYIPVRADGTVIKIYTGSKDYFTLEQYDNMLKDEIGREINLDNLINWGWTGAITKPIAIPLLRALNFIFAYVGNYGTAIIIFTIIFYSLFFPLRWYQSKSFKKAQANAPKMQQIQEKIRQLQKKGVPIDDPRMRELQMEQLRLMKGAIPLGGCLPLLLQIPLFIALYVAVTISLDFRQAHFLWLPDLSAADPWHLLEFLFAGSMVISMALTPTAPAMTPEQKMQQKMMTYLMPLMMLWLLWGAPSGLLLYWFFGNLVSFAQQVIINRLVAEPSPIEQQDQSESLEKKPRRRASAS
ncbi:MAG: membrane protein insertase YidC [Acidobacteriota bacterium]|nr:membrane protein insertase YidC [Pyrinomonadaceae bacterium]MDW8304291.1 membrane protein insertase YidC [Acidobacteriota bacterium]